MYGFMAFFVFLQQNGNYSRRLLLIASVEK